MDYNDYYDDIYLDIYLEFGADSVSNPAYAEQLAKDKGVR
jgi:hypothetical protein